MALSYHSRIIQTIQARLLTISVDAGDTFKPRSVFLFRPNEQAVKNEAIQPAIWLWTEYESKNPTEFVDGSFNEMALSVAFLNRVARNHQEVGAEMAADIEAKLCSGSPYEVGGVTFDVTAQSLQLIVAETDMFQAGGHMEFLVRYTTHVNNPRAIL